MTRSTADSENEKVIQRVLDSYNGEDDRKHPFRITPPLFRIDGKMAENGANDRYYRLPPSENTNGCFVAVITKEVGAQR